MKTLKTIAFAVFTVIAANAAAQEEATLSELAFQSGLSEKQVAMVLGPSSAHAAYRTSYTRCKAQLVRSIGQQRYEQVAAAYREPARRASNVRKTT